MISEEEKVAKILADKINERFKTTLMVLEDRITHLERKLSYIELESVEKVKNMIRAIFEASVESEVRKIANQFFGDFEKDIETLKGRITLLQKQIDELTIVSDALRLVEEKLNATVSKLTSNAESLILEMKDVSSSLDEVIAEKLRERLEEEVGKFFETDVKAVIEKMVRQAVNDAVATKFEKLSKELAEKLTIADDVVFTLKQIAETLEKMKKEIDEIKYTESGVRYEPSTETSQELETELFVEKD